MLQAGMLLAAAVEGGGYISIAKSIAVLVVLLLWARALTWIDKDAPAAQLPREILNAGLLFSGAFAFLLFFVLPTFLLSYVVLWFILLAGVGTYLALRNQKVGLADLKKSLAESAKGTFKGEKKVVAGPGQVLIQNRKGTPLAAPEAEAPERAGYDGAQALLTDPLVKCAERVEMRPSEGAASTQFWVDGVAYNAPSMDRTMAAEAVQYLKTAAGLDLNDRRKPQTGSIRATLSGKRHDVEVTTAGSTAGESLRLLIDPKKSLGRTLDDLGLDEWQMQLVRDAVADKKGVVLVTAPREQGLTTMLYALLRAHDAFLSHIQTIERSPQTDLEGITQNKLTVATPADEVKIVEWVARDQQPDVLMIDQVENPASVRDLLRYAGSHRLYVGMRAGSTFEAVAAWRKLVGDDAAALKSLRMAIAGRVMRRLCAACKVAYAPDAETLRRLNMDPTRVTKLYQARTQPLRDAKGNEVFCEFCQELRYKGRFGVYEVLVMDDEVAQSIMAGASASQFRAVFRKQRGRYLQDQALAMVEAGETGIQEVLRVLRTEERPAGAPARAPSGQPAASQRSTR